MNLNSLKPNAHYDMVNGRPSSIERDNDGTCLFRYKIEPETAIQEGGDQPEQIGWQCVEVRFHGEPNKANIKRAVIRQQIDEMQEFKLINSYNSHILGINNDASAVAEYTELLTFINDIDSIIETEIQ